jgi:hypothetical protein
MSKQGASNKLYRKVLDEPVTLEVVLTRMGQRDKLNVEKHLAFCQSQADPRHARVWTRLARALATLAPMPISSSGQQALAFFVADGRYRMQVFALEDNRDGVIQIYCVDAIDEAVAENLIGKSRADLESVYRVGGDDGQTLTIESLTSNNSPNPATFFKHMLGWNRKAMRITLPVDATDEQIALAETICALTTRKWKHNPAPVEGAKNA